MVYPSDYAGKFPKVSPRYTYPSVYNLNELDVLIDNHFTIQAKCRKKLADFLIPSEHVNSVVFKQDRGETLILLRFDDFLNTYFKCQGCS